MEKFLTTAELIDRLKEYGLMKPDATTQTGRVKVRRWMTRENPVPVHRPDGPNGPLYFLWSEVHAWVRTAWFSQTPDQTNADKDAAAS